MEIEANKTEATIINTIIERKILTRKESIDNLKFFSIKKCQKSDKVISEIPIKIS